MASISKSVIPARDAAKRRERVSRILAKSLLGMVPRVAHLSSRQHGNPCESCLGPGMLDLKLTNRYANQLNFK